jgi:hypothetical protein
MEKLPRLQFDDKKNEDSDDPDAPVAWDNHELRNSVTYQRIEYGLQSICGDWNRYEGKDWRYVKKELDECLADPENAVFISIERFYCIYDWDWTWNNKRDYVFQDDYEEYLFKHPNYDALMAEM